MIANVDRQRGIGLLDHRSLEFIYDGERGRRAKKNQERRRVFHFVSVARITSGLIIVFFIADETRRSWIRASHGNIGRPGDYDVIDGFQKERIENGRT